MHGIRILGVDERDSGWEHHDPRFRVYLHGPVGPGGWTATYDVLGADLLQVVDWAQQQVRTTEAAVYAVALVVDRPASDAAGPDRGLVWLIGRDGNDAAHDPHEQSVHDRMLARAADPVGVPITDRMPDPPTPSTPPRRPR